MAALANRMTGVESSPVRDLLRISAPPGMISFAGGLPAPECFDLQSWRTAFDTALTGASARRNLQYSQTEGNPELRQNVSARLTGRGLPTGADDLCGCRSPRIPRPKSPKGCAGFALPWPENTGLCAKRRIRYVLSVGGYEGRHRGAGDQALDNAWLDDGNYDDVSYDDGNYPALFSRPVDPTASLPRLRLTPVDGPLDGPVSGPGRP
jgi:hypothetical protein